MPTPKVASGGERLACPQSTLVAILESVGLGVRWPGSHTLAIMIAKVAHQIPFCRVTLKDL